MQSVSSSRALSMRFQRHSFRCRASTSTLPKPVSGTQQQGAPARFQWPQTLQHDASRFTMNEGRQERVRELKPGQALIICRQFNHPDDPSAVAICTTAGVLLGYVPQELASAAFQDGVYMGEVGSVGWTLDQTLLAVGVEVKSLDPVLTPAFGLQYTGQE